jgi:hypothetical protein
MVDGALSVTDFLRGAAVDCSLGKSDRHLINLGIILP